MTPAERFKAAMARMDADQIWAVRVVAATERRMRTHYQFRYLPNGQVDGSWNPFPEAQAWALENVT